MPLLPSSLPTVRDAFLPELDASETSFTSIYDEIYNPGKTLHAYYEFFHKSHPFILPQKNFEAKIASPKSSIRTLTSVMEYVGSFYIQSGCKNEIEIQVNNELAELLRSGASDGFAVQALLLMALAQSMCNDHETSTKFLNCSLESAKAIGMQTREFARQFGEFDTFLEESWRRTWWMLYLTEANFAVIQRGFNPTLSAFEQVVELPCEEECYCSGVIFTRSLGALSS